jgi:hypothetical protein
MLRAAPRLQLRRHPARAPQPSRPPPCLGRHSHVLRRDAQCARSILRWHLVCVCAGSALARNAESPCARTPHDPGAAPRGQGLEHKRRPFSSRPTFCVKRTQAPPRQAAAPGGAHRGTLIRSASVNVAPPLCAPSAGRLAPPWLSRRCCARLAWSASALPHAWHRTTPAPQAGCQGGAGGRWTPMRRRQGAARGTGSDQLPRTCRPNMCTFWKRGCARTPAVQQRQSATPAWAARAAAVVRISDACLRNAVMRPPWVPHSARWAQLPTHPAPEVVLRRRL